MNKTGCLFATACAMCAATMFADVKLPTLFTSNMVLQREKEVPVWGWAGPGEEIAVAFAGQNLRTTANAKGE